jgi:hypothetical protein
MAILLTERKRNAEAFLFVKIGKRKDISYE